MKRIGITGNIGCGKSTVCRLFSDMGVPVFDSDSSAKKQYADPSIANELCQILGISNVTPNTIMQSVKRVVAAEPWKLKKLTDLVSPYIFADFETLISANPTAPFVLFESAILFDRKLESKFDGVIGVIAPIALRSSRFASRCGLDEGVAYDQFMYLNNRQAKLEDNLEKCSVIIYNDSDIESLKMQCIDTFKKLK